MKKPMDRKVTNIKELLEIYNLDNEEIGSEEKSKLHRRMRAQYKKKGEISIKHKHVRMLLVNSKGKIMLQRRSKWKGDNPGLWDKTIGGHVSLGESYDLAILKECSQELGIPATIVKKHEFKRAVESTNLFVLAILKRLEINEKYQSTRISKKGQEWVEPSMSAFYFGYYDGSIWFIDSESAGLQLFSLKELKQEIKEKPKMFTKDVKYFLKKYGHLVKPVKTKENILND